MVHHHSRQAASSPERRLWNFAALIVSLLMILALSMTGCVSPDTNLDLPGEGTENPAPPSNSAATSLTVYAGETFQLTPGGTYFIKSFDKYYLNYEGMDIQGSNPETWVHTMTAIAETGNQPTTVQLALPSRDGNSQQDILTYQVTVKREDPNGPPTVYALFPNPMSEASGGQNIISQIKLFAFSSNVENYRICDGPFLAVEKDTILFSLLGTRFGGNGKTNFGLPDLTTSLPLAGMSYQMCTRSGVFPLIDSHGLDKQLYYVPFSFETGDYYVGEVLLANNLPGDNFYGVVPCDGRRLMISEYDLLYAVIGSTFGGDAETFRLPDLSNAQTPVFGTTYYIATKGLFPH